MHFLSPFWGGITIWLGLMYAVVPAALILWARQRRCRFQLQTPAVPETATNSGKKKRLVLWLVIAMIGTACLLGLLLSDRNWKFQYITTVEVQKMVADAKGKKAEFPVMQFQNGYSHFFITLRENGKRTKFSAPVDDATLALLKEQGIKCPTCVQGRDSGHADPKRWVSLLCISVLAAGAAFVLTWAWKKERWFPAPAGSSL
jgi:hypothetical protein